MDLYTLLTKSLIPFNKKHVENHIINKIEEDSHQIGDNDVFVAIKGENSDGHHYIRRCH